jgi:hypothetical protein
MGTGGPLYGRLRYKVIFGLGKEVVILFSNTRGMFYSQ